MCLVVQKNGGGSGTTKGFDLNVEPVWKMGFNGNGVVVSILDDGEWVESEGEGESGVLVVTKCWAVMFCVGIERTNPDLMDNYVSGSQHCMNNG